MKLSRFSSGLIAIIVVALGIVIGPGQAMAQRAMGTDVSSYQGSTVNWATLKTTDGVTWGWAKCAEGTGTDGWIGPDPDFTTNMAKAKAAGVLIGAYYFAHPETDKGTAGADTEAAYFWSVAGSYITTNGHAYIMPMLDVENSYSNVTYMSDWVNEWCKDVVNYAAANNVVITPVVYSSTSFASANYNSTVAQWIPDLAQYPDCTKVGSTEECGSPCPQTCTPSSYSPWSNWVIWQYGDTNWSGGDSDVFNGTLSALTNTLVIGKATSTKGDAGDTLYWDPGNTYASPGSGGSGTWDNSTSNWWLSGTSNVSWSIAADYGVFAGTAGTVTLGASVSADGLTFNTPGYIITGADTLTLDGVTPIINVPPGTPTYLNCVLGGSGYEITGGGILVLENAGNYCGSSSSPEYVNASTLVVLTDHDAGNDAVAMNLENGGIYQDNDTTSGDQFLLPGSAIALLTGGGVFDNPNASLTMSNFVTGSGSLTIIGTTYTLTMTDTANNYSGGTIVQSGELKASAAGVLGSTSGSLKVTGGTLDLGGASHTAGAVTISGGTIQDGTLTGTSYAGQSGTVTAILAGSGAMTQTTSGTLILTGVNTYSGGTTIGGSGVYSIAADSSLGNASSSLTLNGGCLKNDNSSPTLASRTITLGANGGYIDAGWAPSHPITINGKITGSGQLLINLDGSPVVLGNTGNNYTGNTLIGTNGPGYSSAGTQAWLKLGASGVIPNGSGYGDVIINQTYLGLLDLAGFSQTINGLSGTGVVTNSTGNGSLSVGNNNATSTFSGAIKNASGTLSLTKIGTGTLTLNGTNTYNGNTTINAGTLALGTTGSISNSPAVSLAAGATFDVSAISSYALSGSTTLSASGTGTTGSTAATINGASGGTISLGSRSISLTFTPTTFTGDTAHPALYISQGTLSLNSNPFTVNNASGTPLGVGTYLVAGQASGNITSAGSYSVNVTGSGVVSGGTYSLQVIGGNVNLVVVNNSTSFSNLTSSQSITYGTTPITLAGTVSAPGPIYPTNGETITITINGNAQPTTINDSTGDFSLNYNSSNTPARGTPYPITYSYAGNGTLSAATDTSTTLTVNQAALSITANAQSKTYGQAVAFGSGNTNFTTSSLQNGETVGSVTLAVNNNGGAAGAPAATYTITPSLATGGNFSAANYNITYNTNALTVNPAALSITANAQNTTYGQAAAFGGGCTNFTGIGLQNSETIGFVTLTISDNGGATNSPIGIYTISPSVATGGTFAATNYSISYFTNALTVSTAALNITADAQTTQYGQAAVFGDGSTNFTSTGLQNGETIGSVTLTISGDGGATNSPVGTYTITPSLATNGTFAVTNYSISYFTNTLTVTLPPNTIPVTITNVTLLGDGSVQLNFAGTPGYVYMIEATTNLLPPIVWTILSTNAADTNGAFSFDDADATNYTGRYYRTATQ